MLNIKSMLSFVNRADVIRRFVKREKLTIYGAQALKVQTGIFNRDTEDFDIHSKTPRTSARRLEKELDQSAGQNVYYNKKAEHPGTHKVMFIGFDGRRNTEDDVGVADFTNIGQRRTTRIGGIRFVTLSEIAKDKRKSLRDKEFAFRHEKDRDDLERIQSIRKYKKLF